MENYKEKYEQAFERAKNYHEGHTLDVNPQAAMEYVFPELKDEKMRKMIIHVINITPATIAVQYRKEMLDWLEKQGKNEEINEASYRAGIKRVLDNPESYGLEKQGGQKPAWSEEDEKHLLKCLNYFSCITEFTPDYNDFLWLKSLKERYTWKPSDEQIKVFCEVLNFAANHENPHWNDYIFGTLNNLIKQLKKLKE